MKSYNCPSCGAEITFQSGESVYAVCKFCSSTIVRNDDEIQSMGVMASLPEDTTPFRIGSEITYKNVHYALIGRIKVAWEDGFWNEWNLMGDNGTSGWLAEAQGFYAINFETEHQFPKEIDDALKETMSNVHDFSISAHILPSRILLNTIQNINGQNFRIVDIKRASTVGCEGELPRQITTDRHLVSVDLIGKNGGYACIEIDENSYSVFTGEYREWDALHCQNARQFDNWKQIKGAW